MQRLFTQFEIPNEIVKAEAKTITGAWTVDHGSKHKEE